MDILVKEEIVCFKKDLKWQDIIKNRNIKGFKRTGKNYEKEPIILIGRFLK